jgi:hypothetical protein
MILTCHSVVSGRDLKHPSVFVVPVGGCKHFQEMYNLEEESRML